MWLEVFPFGYNGLLNAPIQLNKELNLNSLYVGHTVYPQQINGIMLCGYEWGGENDQDLESKQAQLASSIETECSFANKELRYGSAALRWPYDQRIIRWFDRWGHPLNRRSPGDFEKSIVQTNWCNTQAKAMNGNYAKLKEPKQIENFLLHVTYFKPKIIFLMGRQLINTLSSSLVLPQLEKVIGKAMSSPQGLQKPFPGRRFFVFFQSFENCEIICLPHPSGSRQLSDDYIELFRDQIGLKLMQFKHDRAQNK
jgi:hypothetical protein